MEVALTDRGGGMTVREEFYFGILFVASVWAVMSAVVVAASVRMEDKIFALFFAASFALSALIAAYYFWLLLGGAL
jgi:hypothetical protein